MANSLLTIAMITREAIALFRNTNNFLKSIDTQYDDQYAKTGAKIGTALKIRLPNDYVVRTGAAASIQDTAEQSTTLTLATQKGVDVSFSSLDRTMALDDFSKRVLAPMINNLCGAVAADIMSGVEGGISNYVSNTSGGNVITPTAATWLQAGALLDQMSGPRGERKIVLDPLTNARTVSSLSGLFNPSNKLGTQYSTGTMQEALGFDWLNEQTVIKHLTATYSGTKTVNGAGQTGLAITVNAVTGGFAAGDIITFAGTNSVNRVTKASNGTLAQFVVTATMATGGTSVSIYPALIPSSGGNQVQYQTVDNSPANGATIVVVSASAETYRKNFAFIPDAITMATADLQIPPKGVVEAAREVYEGISMRMISDYVIATDQWITRLDILYGYKFVRPEWACVVADAV